MTDKRPEALRLADELYELDVLFSQTGLCAEAAAELRRLHEVNAELVEIFKRMKFEQGFACECGIEAATRGLIESAIAKATGEQQ